MTNVLITGATGFLGAHLADYLLSKGFHVRSIRRSNSNMQLISDLEQRIEWHNADLLDPEALYEAMQGIDQVYHCAAMVSFHPRDKEKMHAINVHGTSNVVNMALETGVKKLVHVSSIAALGRDKNRKHLDESVKWVESKDNTQYAISKYRSELEAWRGIAEGLPVAIVNPAVILGAGFWDAGAARFFTQVDQGLKFWPPGHSGMVDVRDVARFMYLLMESDIVGQRYLLSAEDFHYRDLFNGIADQIGAKHPIIKVTPLLAEVAWRVEWLKEKILGTQPMVTKESARASLNSYTYANEKSVKAFDFKYIPVKQTIADTAKVYLESKKLGGAPMRLKF